MTAGQLIEHLRNAPQGVAAWVCGISPRSFRDRHAPRNEDGSYNVQDVVASLTRAFEEDVDLVAGPIDSPSMERLRTARAEMAELDLAERRGQIVSVELFQGVMQAAFVPLRRFAEHQIKEHGNGTADAWREAVELFEREVKGVVGKTSDSDGTSGDAATAEPVDSAATDADH
jgi:hypothetical protein